MCGIAGIFHFDNSRLAEAGVLKKMTDSIQYRGPDAEGHYFDSNVALGHRRLSIIDLSTGSQPMISEDQNIVTILNGEIYNYIELREELIAKGHKFKTNSDTEVVINAYREWGIDCQTRFNGMWAFAIWDKTKKQLFLSRDRIGEKPLHYANYNNTLYFGSEIKAILAAGVPKVPRFELLELFSVFKYIPAPHTFYKNIFKLLPGHFAIVNSSGVKLQKYWDLPEINEDDLVKDKTIVNKRFEELLFDSVRIRMRCDVPFGAFLSGGLDSASIVALMNQHSRSQVHTFTIGFSESDYDESALAEMVAKRFNTIHHLNTVTQDGFTESLERVLHHFDEPFGDSSAIPTGYISKFAAKKVKMVLTGDGGDEVLSGYTAYQGIKFAQAYKKLPKLIQDTLPGITAFSSRMVTGRIRYKLNRVDQVLRSSSQNFNERLILKQSKPGLPRIRTIIAAGTPQWKVEDYLQEQLSQCSYKDDFYKQMYFNFKRDLPDDMLVKVDRMSMAYSLETRVPFLDHRLVEFMAGVDKNVKMEGWERKSVLRNTIAKKLPPELLSAPKKGFRVPVREWFKNKQIKDILSAACCANPHFQKEVVEKLIEENYRGEADHGNLLWSLLLLSKNIGDGN